MTVEERKALESVAGETVAGAGGARPHVAFSGEPGAFADDAVRSYFVDPIPLGVGGFREVFEAVVGRRAIAGVLPIENLVNGTVRENYDLLLEHDLVIVGEVVVPVQLCLAALPGQTIDEIERVYSHIQALGQADRYLRTRPWSLLTTYNTAGAGRMIVDRGERRAAAVLSPRAAAIFGLEVLAAGIQTVPDNRTRFVVVMPPGESLEPAVVADPGSAAGAMRTTSVARPMRTTLVMAIRNEPGELHQALGIFAAAGLNMSKLESRPAIGRAWEYVFWVDLDADASEPATIEALEALRAKASMVRVLGTYHRAAE